MQSSSAKTLDVVRQTESTGRSPEEIIDAVRRVEDMNTQIASAAEEQLCLTEDVSRNVTRIAEKADRSAEKVEHFWNASVHLQELSTALMDQVSHFKT